MRIGKVSLAVLSFAVLLSCASPSEASCTDPIDLAAFRRAVGIELRCRLRALQAGTDPECIRPPIPACATGSLDELVDLLFGDA